LYQPEANALRDEVLVDFATSVEANLRPTTPARARAIDDTRKNMVTESPFGNNKSATETAKRRFPTKQRASLSVPVPVPVAKGCTMVFVQPSSSSSPPPAARSKKSEKRGEKKRRRERKKPPPGKRTICG
jgi:hypothetical protein